MAAAVAALGPAGRLGRGWRAFAGAGPASSGSADAPRGIRGRGRVLKKSVVIAYSGDAWSG
ncbi:hypothetical protein BN2497_13593 [Janthinobacterium sp. CG23_2]|nr:hypothetical protein BN2497_13593 [Janthinobacterium sp. CG23_2]CUU33194.1 hypothetical protein BN3177_13593 [Janthinobacterium sp. CG23_2]